MQTYNKASNNKAKPDKLTGKNENPQLLLEILIYLSQKLINQTEKKKWL